MLKMTPKLNKDRKDTELLKQFITQGLKDSPVTPMILTYMKSCYLRISQAEVKALGGHINL